MPTPKKATVLTERLIAKKGDEITLTDGTRWRITKIEQGSVYGEPVSIRGRGRRLRPAELPRNLQLT